LNPSPTDTRTAVPARGTATAFATAVIAAIAAAAAPALAGETCSAHSAATMPPVVELYTSEGCNSCPPADRWLSKLKAEPGVVALAFHVDYWDRLGWKDRFASAAFTSRQAEQQASNGARFSYTPQVVVDGQDRKDWPGIALPLGKRPPAPVEVALTREGERVSATVAAGAGSPKRLAAYWAVTEQGHITAVKAGENRGATLQHDFVVRDYQAVPAWAPRAGAAQSIAFQLPARADATRPREVNLVVVDAESGRPVQALKIGC
jgi:hypothetical protein